MTDISDEIKRQLIEQKIDLWRRTYYDAELDAKIAEALDDPQLKRMATERMKKALKAVDVLEKLLNEEAK